jgi:serine/threonine-protein kinase
MYSLGCCAYEMLVGASPFDSPTAQVVMARHSLEQVPSMVIARQGIPEHVEATVMRALAKSPADRFRTAAEFADALNERITVRMPRMSGAVQQIAAPPRRALARSRAARRPGFWPLARSLSSPGRTDRTTHRMRPAMKRTRAAWQSRTSKTEVAGASAISPMV